MVELTNIYLITGIFFKRQQKMPKAGIILILF